MDRPPSLEIFRLGTRGSDLALWQTNYVRQRLQATWPGLKIEIKRVSTRGDQILDTPLPLIGGKGLFTAELENGLRQGNLDAAVHSLKDLPTDTPDSLTVGAIPPRANPADVLISRRGYTLNSLPQGAIVGTSSHRRAAQLRRLRPDLKMADLRGNVPTRIRKALDTKGPYDAIILAHAGLERLGRLDVISEVLSLEQVLPAPGQGAMAVQCRDEGASLEVLEPLNDNQTMLAVTAERALLNALGGGCSVPVGAFGRLEGERLLLTGRISSPDGAQHIDVEASGPSSEALILGQRLAEEALSRGAAKLLGAAA